MAATQKITVKVKHETIRFNTVGYLLPPAKEVTEAKKRQDAKAKVRAELRDCYWAMRRARDASAPLEAEHRGLAKKMEKLFQQISDVKNAI